MNFFEKSSLALLTAVVVIATATQAAATPEQPMDGEFSLETYAEEAGLDFTPPSFDYSPISQDEPLVKAETWQTIGQNAMVAGDYPNALAAFDKAVQLLPEETPEVLEQRGWLHYSLGDEAAALEDMSQAAELHLDNNSYAAHNNALRMREFVDLQFDS